jgi:hypothetical protein
LPLLDWPAHFAAVLRSVTIYIRCLRLKIPSCVRVTTRSGADHAAPTLWAHDDDQTPLTDPRRPGRLNWPSREALLAEFRPRAGGCAVVPGPSRPIVSEAKSARTEASELPAIVIGLRNGIAGSSPQRRGSKNASCQVPRGPQPLLVWGFGLSRDLTRRGLTSGHKFCQAQPRAAHGDQRRLAFRVFHDCRQCETLGGGTPVIPRDH